MTDADKLVLIDLVNFREQALEGLKQRHPQLMSIANTIFSGKKNRVGLELTSDGKSIGQYTLHLEGLNISHAEAGKLDPSVHYPLIGAIRLYGIIDREVLEHALADQKFLTDPLSAIGHYLPDITIKFLP